MRILISTDLEMGVVGYESVSVAVAFMPQSSVRGRRVKPASREAYADSGEDLHRSTRPKPTIGWSLGHAQILRLEV